MKVTESLFWSKVRKLGVAECWEWRGYKDADGYGMYSVRGEGNLRAHRVAYSISIGSPVNLVIRHTCDNPACCNPAHLVGGTHADNVRDRVSRGRGRNRTSRFLLSQTRHKPRLKGKRLEKLVALGILPR